MHGRDLETGKVKHWKCFNEKLGQGVEYLYSCACIGHWARAVSCGIQIPHMFWLTQHTENSFRKPGAVLQQRNRQCFLRTKSHQDLYTDMVKKPWDSVYRSLFVDKQNQENLRTCWEYKFFVSTADLLNQKPDGFDPAVYILTSLPVDSNICSSLRRNQRRFTEEALIVWIANTILLKN